jgi:hypothetical protein
MRIRSISLRTLEMSLSGQPIVAIRSFAYRK